MAIKLTNCRKVGRYANKTTGKEVNIHKGRHRSGWDSYFYLRSGKRVFVMQSEMGEAWRRIQP